jgi:hypothetical protein
MDEARGRRRRRARAGGREPHPAASPICRRMQAARHPPAWSALEESLPFGDKGQPAFKSWLPPAPDQGPTNPDGNQKAIGTKKQ